VFACYCVWIKSLDILIHFHDDLTWASTENCRSRGLPLKSTHIFGPRKGWSWG